MKDVRVYVISGYRQGKQRWNGSINISERLRDEWNGGLNNVTYLTWDSNWKAHAEFMWLIQDDKRKGKTKPPVNIVCGYSYGGGWGARRLMKFCNRRGVDIDHAILCDPVHRGPLGWIGSWPIVIPGNVKRVTLLRQDSDYPRGCRVKTMNQYTSVVERMLNTGHVWCDDHPLYLHEINSAISEVLQCGL
jgi:hypothetical protein